MKNMADNEKSKVKQPRLSNKVPVKVGMTDVNECIICQLCSGYLVDATAIIECQHTCK